MQELFTTRKQEMTITCENGFQIMFTGLDDAEKLKSIRPKKGVITDIWIEEATEVSQQSMKLLNKRLRGRDAYSKDFRRVDNEVYWRFRYGRYERQCAAVS